MRMECVPILSRVVKEGFLTQRCLGKDYKKEVSRYLREKNSRQKLEQGYFFELREHLVCFAEQ